MLWFFELIVEKRLGIKETILKFLTWKKKNNFKGRFTEAKLNI